MHEVAARFGGLGVANDISPNALREGVRRARQRGTEPTATPVASDFHDLPFASGFFDLVFISSAVHHTFRPWAVIAELLRVLRPGGILQVENEPVARALCLYQYRCNRPESFTPFELALDAAGMTRTVSSPFPGSRPEELFGMIENDRIELDCYLEAFAADGTLLALSLDHQATRNAFDDAVLALPRDADLPASIFAMVSARVREAEMCFAPADMLLGFSVPRREQLWTMSYRVAGLLRALPPPGAAGHDHAMARLFGAALRATIAKTGGVRSETMLRRVQPVVDGVAVDFIPAKNIGLALLEPQLPDIATSTDAALAARFASADWKSYQEESGLQTLLNMHANPAIHLPPLPQGGLFLMRFFAAARPEPYTVSLYCNGRRLAEETICQAESRLAELIVPAGCEMVILRLHDLQGMPVEDQFSLHVVVAQLLPLSDNG